MRKRILKCLIVVLLISFFGFIDSTLADGPAYYILTTNDIIYGNAALGLEKSKQMDRFIESKEHRGFSVMIVTEDRRLHAGQVVSSQGWGGGYGAVAAENIRYWLTRLVYIPSPFPVYMPNWQYLGIRYLLLIGNPDPISGDVPMKKFINLANVPTDYYYSELNGPWTDISSLDTQAEIPVGRIPVYNHSMADLDHILAKIVKYENTRESHTKWRANVLLPTSYKNAMDSFTTMGETLSKQLYVNGYASFTGAVRGDPFYYRLYEDYPDNEEGDPINYGHFPPNDYFEICVMDQFDELEEIDPTAPDFRCNTTCCTEEADQDDRYRGDFGHYFTTIGLLREHEFGIIAWAAHGSQRVASRVLDADYVNDLSDNRPVFAFQNSCKNGFPDVSGGFNGPNGNYNLAYTLLLNGAISTIAGTRNIGSHEKVGARYVEELLITGMTAGDALIHARANTEDVLKGDMLLFNLYGDPALGTHSTALVSDPDSDGDGIVDLYDNCPDFPNFSQSDADHDSIGDACQAQNNVLLGLGALGLSLTCAGDIDHDGDVDGSDLAVFAADFGRTNCDTEEQCEGDFDDDNDVDGSDLAVFAADFGKTDCGSMPDDLVDVTEITKGWIGSWNFGFTNDVEGVGDLDGDGKDDFVITSVWGFGIVKVDDSGQFVLLGIFPWQDSGEWFQEQGSRFIGVGDFSGVNGAAQEILVITSQGIGLIYLAGGQIETLALTDFGTAIPGVDGGEWVLKVDDRISQHVGDIDGDGFDDIIIRSVWGIGFLKVSSKGEFLSLKQYEWGTQIGKWVLRPNDRLAGIGNFATGAKKEIIFQSNTYLGIFRYANNIEGLENLEMVDGPIMGAGGKSWDLSPFDQVAGLGRLQPGSDLDALVFKSGSDLGVIAWEESGGFYVISVHSWGADVGGWTLERRHNIEGIGDINGDGLDEIIIWDANSGIAILKQNGDGLTSISHAEQYTMLGNWYLYPDNDVLAIGRFCSPVADGILLKSYDR